MQRRDFLYVAGVGLVAGAGGVWVNTPTGATVEAGATPVDSEAAGHTVVLAAGAAFSLRTLKVTDDPRPGDLRYHVTPDGCARLDVVGFQPRIASSETKSPAHFQQLATDSAFALPRWDTRLHASEAMIYALPDAVRLGRRNAQNTYTMVQRDDGDWAALHVREANTDRLVLQLVERANAA